MVCFAVNISSPAFKSQREAQRGSGICCSPPMGFACGGTELFQTALQQLCTGLEHSSQAPIDFSLSSCTLETSHCWDMNRHHSHWILKHLEGENQLLGWLPAGCLENCYHLFIKPFTEHAQMWAGEFNIIEFIKKTVRIRSWTEAVDSVHGLVVAVAGALRKSHSMCWASTCIIFLLDDRTL